MARFAICLLCLQILIGTAQEEFACADLSTDRIASFPYEPQFVSDDGGTRVLDRCEGRYAGRRSGALSVRTFTALFEEFRLDLGQPLTIRWETPALATSGRVRLLAQGVVRRLFYRMDSERAITDASFSWPLDILEGLRLERDHVGVLGFTHVPLKETERRVYLPLRITQEDVAKASSSYQVGVWTESRLDAVYMHLAPLTWDGDVGDFLPSWNRRERLHVPVPAERLFTITIPVADLPAPGLYVMRISALIAGGGASVTEFHFLHSIPDEN
jgi:hypothetical protein